MPQSSTSVLWPVIRLAPPAGARDRSNGARTAGRRSLRGSPASIGLESRARKSKFCRRLIRVFTCASVGLALGLAAAQVATASTWRVQAGPPSVGGILTGVSCPSTIDCLAVGGYTARSTRTLAEHWDGVRWSLEPAAVPSRTIDISLNAVSCTSATVCIAVGDFRLKGNEMRTLAERWDGSRWSIERTPNQARFSGSELLAVSCSSPRACTATGDYGPANGPVQGALIEQWNGARWSIRPSTSASARDGQLVSVSCPSSRFCVAVGSTTEGSAVVEQWSGAGWSIQPTPGIFSGDSTQLNGVSCTSAKACTAVGADNDVDAGLVERWNGARWSSERSPDAVAGNAFLEAVSCNSAKACTAVGTDAGGDTQLAEGWNGSHWVVERTPVVVQPTPPGIAAESALNDDSCPSDGVCVAVGQSNTFGSRIDRPLIERRG
jgi:hypothetical protein